MEITFIMAVNLAKWFVIVITFYFKEDA